MRYNNINQYEILEVSKTLGLVRRMKPICIYKVQLICKYLSNKVKNSIFWYNNIEKGEFEIYTEIKNVLVVKKALEELEEDYKRYCRKRDFIIKHRHKN